MEAKKIKYFQNKLLALRSDILNRAMARDRAALTINPEDLADESDHAAAVVQQNLTLGSHERDRTLLLEIDRALGKIEFGTYGLCEDTEEPIEEARLEAQPWTRYCIEAAELREKQAKRYASAS